MHTEWALSAWQITMMVVVIAASLAIWITAVFLAARQPRGTSAAANAGPREGNAAVTVTQLSPEAGPSDKAAV